MDLVARVSRAPVLPRLLLKGEGIPTQRAWDAVPFRVGSCVMLAGKGGRRDEE
jgi:hypothetical protein